MKNTILKTLTRLASAMLGLLFFTCLTSEAQVAKPLRRPVSQEQPMYLIHIDTWNYADPQKIIDLIPQSIRPYVVMNISLSISHNATTGQFQVAEYGYEIAKSWLRTCAQNQMWAIVQCASGGMGQFSDFDLSVYEEFYRDYPNMIGFNYAEQFWGYDEPNDPVSAKWADRMNHFANLLELSNRYGGYLVVSWCGNQWSPSINPIGMLKRIPAFATACEKYTENYILCEKHTQQSYQYDMESLCLGAYLSGYSGNYGIRYDDTGWTDVNGNHEGFSMATMAAPFLEHTMLTGQTVVDGPELIWTQCFKETNRVATSDGYTKRNWETFPQFRNVAVDNFLKIIDGTVRIPTRKEVIDKTKFVIINNVNTGTVNDMYSSPQTLYEGLYRMDGDGNYEYNKTFFKKTGRYPTIPVVYNLHDELANTFQYKVNRSNYSSRWTSISSKVNEFNSVFAEEYTGDLYAGRHENGWVIYNPFKTGQDASASIPFKYNTSERVDLTFSQYTTAIMKEYADKVTFYLSNFDNMVNTSLKTNTIKIYGSTVEPTFSFVDRGNHQASSMTGSWNNGVFTLTIQQNGPLDLTINCNGTGTNRLTEYTQAKLVVPSLPSLYDGPRQYEAECFDYKSINSITTGGQNGNIRYYTGQGYLRVGTSSSATVRDSVFVLRSGKYKLVTRYAVTGSDANSMDLYVNGVKVATPVFTKTASTSDWANNVQIVELKQGGNEIKFQAYKSGPSSLYFDNITISQGENNGIYHFEGDKAEAAATNPPAELVTIKSGTAGVVSHLANDGVANNRFKAYTTGSLNNTGVADLDMFPTDALDYSIVWKQFNTSTETSKNAVMLRANGVSGHADGLKQGYLFVVENNANGTFNLKNYVVDGSGIVEKSSFVTDFTVATGTPCWFRASAIGDQITFECSVDSSTWVGESITSFNDATHKKGATQLVWGLGTTETNWLVDNIGFIYPSSLDVSMLNIGNLTYQKNTGPSNTASFNLFANGIANDLIVSASANFEISLEPTAGFSGSVAVEPLLGKVDGTTVYVRLKAGLNLGKYNGEVSISAAGVPNSSQLGKTVTVSGEVVPVPFGKKYDFTNDVATTGATNPPAENISIGAGNPATAGVVSYTDNQSITSNCLTKYSGGEGSTAGVLNLDLFPKEATNYSITWKQMIANVSLDSKHGVLLRGDATMAGGYAPGLKQGYVFIVYNKTSGGSEFRIYKSTPAASLSMLTNAAASTLVITTGQPVWYRASVSGTNPVTLKFEYSTNNSAWNTVANYADSSSPLQGGSSQIVWGLATANHTVRMDDIEFHGIALDETPTNVSKPSADNNFVVHEEYYNLNGQKMDSRIHKTKGLYILKQLMSDGTYMTTKVLVK
jgi:hypothetical protein